MRRAITIFVVLAALGGLGAGRGAAAAEGPYRFFQIYDLPVLMLWGSPEEAGRIHGEVFRPQIQHLVRHVLYQKILRGTPEQMREATLGYLKRGLARLPAPLVRELTALAQGAGVSLQDIYLLNFFAEAVLYPACSTIGVAPGRAAGKQGLVGHNLDWPEAAGAPVVLLAYGTPGAIPFVAVTVPGIPFPTLGMNRAGLCVTLNSAFSIEPLPPEAQFILPKLRQALAECDNVTQAERLLTRQPRYHAWNVLLAGGKQQRMLLLELGHRHASVRQPKEGLLISTNYLASPALRPVMHPADAGSVQRANRLLELASDKAKLSVHDLERFLLDPQVWEETVYSAVAAPAGQKLMVCPSPGRTYTPVEVGKILKSFPRQGK